MSSLFLAALLGASVHVGSKNFAESRLLAEIFAQSIEARGIAVERHLGLGGSEVAFRAVESGALDVYPEYDGTALLVLLKEPLEPPGGGPRRIAERVAAGLSRRQLAWLSPLGFSDDWVIAVRETIAQREHLSSLSELAASTRAGLALSGGFSAEFLGRQDGLFALEKAYQFALREAQPMSEPLKYGAVASGAIDLLDAYSTDSRLEGHGIRALADDRHFFPSYLCAPLARADLAARFPAAQTALLELAGRIDLGEMRALNARVQAGAAEADVAGDWLRGRELGLTAAEPIRPRRSGLVAFLRQQRAYLIRLLGRHLELTFGALLAASCLGVPLGLVAARRPVVGTLILRGVSVAQTIPGLPLLAFLVPWLGIGVWPSLVALFLYALLPIVQSTHAGLTSIDPDLVWVATGQGMTERQIGRWIRIPLATGVALSGVRIAAVTTVGNATLAAFVGGGGLGEPILAGLALNDTRLILLGAIPAAMLALLFDAGLAWLARRLAPVR